MQHINQEFKKLSLLMKELSDLEKSGITSSDNIQFAMMTLGIVASAVVAVLVVAVAPIFLLSTMVPVSLFIFSRSVMQDSYYGVSEETRARYNECKKEVDMQLSKFLSISKIINKINYKNETQAQAFGSFLSQYLKVKLMHTVSNLMPSKMHRYNNAEVIYTVNDKNVNEDLLTNFSSFANRPVKIFKSYPVPTIAIDAARHCTDLLQEYGVSIMDMLEINFITKDAVEDFVSNGYQFTLGDYEILNSMLKSDTLSPLFLNKLMAKSATPSNFNINHPLVKDYVNAPPSSVPTYSYTPKNSPLPVITGPNTNMSPQALTLLQELQHKPEGKLVTLLFEQDPQVYEKYSVLVSKINLVKELPLPLEDKTELVNIEKKVLPEILEIYAQSQNVIDNDKVVDFLSTSIDNITLSIEAVSTRFANNLENQADALSRYTHTKTLSMGGKK